MAHSARESTLNHFSVRGMADNTENVYREVLERNRPENVDISPIRIKTVKGFRNL